VSVTSGGEGSRIELKLCQNYVHITSIYVPYLNIFVLLPVPGYRACKVVDCHRPTSLFQAETFLKLNFYKHIIYQIKSNIYVQFRPEKIFGIGCNPQKLWTIKVLGIATCGPKISKFRPRHVICLKTSKFFKD
jgi:hypothetical protein